MSVASSLNKVLSSKGGFSRSRHTNHQNQLLSVTFDDVLHLQRILSFKLLKESFWINSFVLIIFAFGFAKEVLFWSLEGDSNVVCKASVCATEIFLSSRLPAFDAAGSITNKDTLSLIWLFSSIVVLNHVFPHGCMWFSVGIGGTSNEGLKRDTELRRQVNNFVLNILWFLMFLFDTGLIGENDDFPSIFVEFLQLLWNFGKQPSPISSIFGKLCTALWSDQSIVHIETGNFCASFNLR
mmetsp:Transcript_3485/g.4799  ORF Transcript_3485/g.4799 Transcript_3485/m.4799 type:complete len:239 (-) Transcript_3485:292-1008(-)